MTDFDDTQHYAIFTTGLNLTSETGNATRWSEQVVAALRSAGILDNVIDGTTAPGTSSLWLDKNSDPAILKKWDSAAAAWRQVSYSDLFPVSPWRGTFFNYSTTTSDADPGDGYFRFDNANPSSATELYIDNLENGGADVSAWIDTFDDSTNTSKGTLQFVDFTDPTVFAVYRVSGSVVDGTGYRKVTISHVVSAGTFSADRTFTVQFTATGDQGGGSSGLWTGTETIITSVATGDIVPLQDVSDSDNPKRATLANILATLLVSIRGLSVVAGDIIYGTAANTVARLAKGTAGQVLTMNAGATAPEWTDSQSPLSISPLGAFADGTVWAHGLTTVNTFGANAVCVVANNGYAVGDKIRLATDDGSATLSSIYADGTNIGYRTVGTRRFSNKSTGAAFNLTATDWNIEFWVMGE